MDQFMKAPVNTATAGCLTGALPRIRETVLSAMTEAFNGGTPLDAAINKAEDQAAKVIENYNETGHAMSMPKKVRPMNYIDYIADPTRPCAIVAHRGMWRSSPENSLPAIEGAISAGYDVVEIDVRRSADGEYFLLHDDTLERMTDLNLEPEKLTWDELARLKLRGRDGGELNQMTQEKVPSLKEVFDLTRDRILVHLDVKSREIIPGVITCAQSMGVDRQVDFWGNLRTLEDLHWIRETVEPHALPFIAKTRLEAADAEKQLDLVFELNPFICEISFRRIEQVAELRERFQQADMALWVNTLDSVSSAGFTDTAALADPEAVWGRLIEAGVSAIQTDEAEALKSFIKKRQV